MNYAGGLNTQLQVAARPALIWFTTAGHKALESDEFINRGDLVAGGHTLLFGQIGVAATEVE